MVFEALVSFLLLLQMRKTLKTFSPDPAWERLLKQGMIAVGVLAALTEVLHSELVMKWVWLPIMLGIVSLALRDTRFFPIRMSVYAVLPLLVLSAIHTFLDTFLPNLSRTIREYIGYAYPVAVTWLIALLILSQRQLKALKEERKKRLSEEEEMRVMAVRKAELEALVNERTAELLQQKDELQLALKDLKATQTQLIQREKMASLGELTAGIAHEIKNPLNFINNFSELNVELAGELRQHINHLPIDRSIKEELFLLLHDLVQNQKKIHHHGARADAIVKSMLQHSRKSEDTKTPTDINALADEYLRLCYHGLRAKDKSMNVMIETHFDPAVNKITVNEQDIGRVLLNLFTNAFYAVTEKRKRSNDVYEPSVQVSTKKSSNKVEISVKDNGTGIPEKVLDKIYQPFFTTKPTGEGTGLGLSLSYDIITKGHGGDLRVRTKENEGAEFIVQLPAG